MELSFLFLWLILSWWHVLAIWEHREVEIPCSVAMFISELAAKFQSFILCCLYNFLFSPWCYTWVLGCDNGFQGGNDLLILWYVSTFSFQVYLTFGVSFIGENIWGELWWWPLLLQLLVLIRYWILYQFILTFKVKDVWTKIASLLHSSAIRDATELHIYCTLINQTQHCICYWYKSFFNLFAG